MEEVDAILLTQLRDIGCEIDDEVEGISALDSTQVMKCVAQCLGRIASEDEEFENMPTANMITGSMNMSHKYKYATQLSSCIQSLGYKSDIGYQTFMYSSENEIRRLLLFLIERISKDYEDEDEKSLDIPGKDSQTGVNVLHQLKHLNINTIWIPGNCCSSQIIDDVDDELKYSADSDYADRYSARPNPNAIYTAHSLGFSIDSFLAKSHLKPLQRYAKYKLQQFEGQNVLLPITVMDILEWNNQFCRPTTFDDEDGGGGGDLIDRYISDCLAKNKAFLASVDDKIEDGGMEDPVRSSTVEASKQIAPAAVKHDGDREMSKEELNELELEKLKLRSKNYDEKIGQLRAADNELAKCEAEYQERCKIFEASYKSKEELEDSITGIKGQIEEIASTWEDIQTELLANLKVKRSENFAQSQEYRDKVKKINELKKSISSKIKEIQSKKTLTNELEAKTPQQWPPGRSSYTRRIIEIIGNVKKQNEETRKVLLETKSIQKDINTLNGKIERIFTVADEVIFREAKLNEWNRKCYKLLALLQTTFSQLLEAVNAIGVHLREIRQLEEMVDNEKTRKTSSNLARINADLRQIRLENEQLKAKLQQKATD